MPMDAEVYVDRVFAAALERRATDIHFEPHGDGCAVLFRVDGLLHREDRFPLEDLDRVTSRIKVLANLPVYEKEAPFDASLLLGRGEEVVRARLSILPTLHGDKCVIRLFHRIDEDRSLESLGLEEEVLADLAAVVERRQGAILFTGPSGSGKTTTIYALLERIHRTLRGETSIVTIEDPVERDLGFAAQTPYSKCRDLTYSQALSHLLRQDPEIIVVGEIRDPETARIAIRAGLTGHLVISTLHSRETSEVFPRLLEMGIENYLVACSISGVVGQRLARVLCPHCKRPTESADAIRERFELEGDIEIFEPVGCPACNSTGCFGRTAIGESLRVSESLREMVLHKVRLSTFREDARRLLSISLAESARRALCRGVVSAEEILRILPESEKGAEYELV